MARYVGTSQFVRWWPWAMVVIAVVLGIVSGDYAGYAVFFVLCGVLFAWLLPWRFVVMEEGIGLWFSFGRRRFLPKSEIVVRAGRGSPVAYRGENRRFGYPLTDGILEQRRRALTESLELLGFRLV